MQNSWDLLEVWTIPLTSSLIFAFFIIFDVYLKHSAYQNIKIWNPLHLHQDILSKWLPPWRKGRITCLRIKSAFWLPDDWYYLWNHGGTCGLSLDFFNNYSNHPCMCVLSTLCGNVDKHGSFDIYIYIYTVMHSSLYMVNTTIHDTTISYVCVLIYLIAVIRKFNESMVFPSMDTRFHT